MIRCLLNLLFYSREHLSLIFCWADEWQVWGARGSIVRLSVLSAGGLLSMTSPGSRLLTQMQAFQAHPDPFTLPNHRMTAALTKTHLSPLIPLGVGELWQDWRRAPFNAEKSDPSTLWCWRDLFTGADDFLKKLCQEDCEINASEIFCLQFNLHFPSTWEF